MKSFSKISGLLFIAIGIVLFLNTLGYITVSLWQIIGIYWPLILIYIGIAGLLNHKNPLINSLISFIGLAFLGDNLDLFDFNVFVFIYDFWSIILIVLGLSLLLKSNKK